MCEQCVYEESQKELFLGNQFTILSPTNLQTILILYLVAWMSISSGLVFSPNTLVLYVVYVLGSDQVEHFQNLRSKQTKRFYIFDTPV